MSKLNLYNPQIII